MLNLQISLHIVTFSFLHSYFTAVKNYIKSIPHNPDFKQPPKNEAFENIWGKGENAGNHHFLFFPKCFLPSARLISVY